MSDRLRGQVRRIDRMRVSRGVSRDSVTLAAAFVSIAAGLFLVTGGVAREPWLWLLVPLLGVARLALAALVDCPHKSDDSEV